MAIDNGETGLSVRTELNLALGLVETAVQGDGTILRTVALTQAAYDAITPKVATTLYVITDA